PDPTQPKTAPAPTRSGSVGPGTRAAGGITIKPALETGGTDPTPLGTAPASSLPGNARPGGLEPSASLALTRTIIAGMSAAATGLLLLLVAVVCYRGRKGPAPRQSRESEAAGALPSQPQEPDSGADGLTYTELGCQAALQ
ncbi:hypothetical protein G0U57_013086, partial [Chelydra serpentina]